MRERRCRGRVQALNVQGYTLGEGWTRSLFARGEEENQAWKRRWLCKRRLRGAWSQLESLLLLNRSQQDGAVPAYFRRGQMEVSCVIVGRGSFCGLLRNELPSCVFKFAL